MSTERFSNRVENYVKYRPGYPKEFIDYLYKNVGFSKQSIIADIGSGTGRISEVYLNWWYSWEYRAYGQVCWFCYMCPVISLVNHNLVTEDHIGMLFKKGFFQLFERYEVNGKVSFEYETEGYIGEL